MTDSDWINYGISIGVIALRSESMARYIERLKRLAQQREEFNS